MPTFTERINHALSKAPGIRQADLARACNISTASVNNWFSGQTQSLKGSNLIKVAELLKVNPLWLSEGKGPMRKKKNPDELEDARSVRSYDPEDQLPDTHVLVHEYRIDLSAGNGSIAYELEETEPRVYSRHWFSREKINPEHVRRFRVRGMNMEPVLYDGDIVLVNLDESDPERIMDGKIYAIRYGDELRVKRLFRKLDGSLILHSENPIYKPEEVASDVANEHITIIGRVRDKSGAGGL